MPHPSFSCKKQYSFLQQEYERLGSVFSNPKNTLLSVVERVDVDLSKNQEYLIQEAEGRQFLCNVTAQTSWWLPSTNKFDTKVHRREDGVPYLFDETAGRSWYAIDMQKKLMKNQSAQPASGSSDTPARANIPLPPSSSSALPPAPAAAPPLTNVPPPSPSASPGGAIGTHGSVPLPGAVTAPASAPYASNTLFCSKLADNIILNQINQCLMIMIMIIIKKLVLS